MLRPEILVLGCALTLLGAGLVVFGYQNAQPTTSEQVLQVLEDLSGEQAPADWKRSRALSYACMGGGALSVLGGLAAIAMSRQAEKGSS